jgi:hypothetical protein
MRNGNEILFATKRNRVVCFDGLSLKRNSGFHLRNEKKVKRKKQSETKQKKRSERNKAKRKLPKQKEKKRKSNEAKRKILEAKKLMRNFRLNMLNGKGHKSRIASFRFEAKKI